MSIGFTKINTADLPKDARWQDMIQQLKCPQCLMHQSSSISSLEKHVTLQCKYRSSFLKNLYLKKLKKLAHETDDNALHCVRLMLEAKLLQWRKEGVPEIPLLLRQTESPKEETNNKSALLDLWRLWMQEVDMIGIDHCAQEMLQLVSEAESLEWDPLRDDGSYPPIQGDDQLNLQLMSQVGEQLKAMKNEFIDMGNNDEGEKPDLDVIARLENEAYLLSCMSQ